MQNTRWRNRHGFLAISSLTWLYPQGYTYILSLVRQLHILINIQMFYFVFYIKFTCLTYFLMEIIITKYNPAKPACVDETSDRVW